MDRNLFLTGFLLIAGIIVGGWYGPSLLMETAAVQSWQPTPATLIDARPSRESMGGRSMRSHHYLIHVRYRYEVNGQKHTGTRYQVSQTMIEPGKTDALLRIDELMANPKIQVYVNPDNPAQAVMDRGGSGHAWLVTLFGLAMAASGAIVYFTRVRMS